MTEYPTSQEGPPPAAAAATPAPGGPGMPAATGGCSDELGHGKAPVPSAEAVRGSAAPGDDPVRSDVPRPRGEGVPAAPQDGTPRPRGRARGTTST
ncbi:hypothetical protein ACFXDA_34255, partial [Streptomyces sp. NPDC059389]